MPQRFDSEIFEQLLIEHLPDIARQRRAGLGMAYDHRSAHERML
jgi:hypothetical protein